MNENDINSLFGYEPAQEPEGEEEQEVAAPAEEEELEGGEEQEVAEPAVEESEEGSAKGGKTAEDSRYAKARRKAEAERDAAIREAREAAEKTRDDAWSSAIAGLGLKGRDGKIITTLEQLGEASADAQRNRIEREMKAGTMSTQQLEEAAAELPGIKQRLDAAQKAEAEARAAKAKADFDRQFAEIAKHEPGIKNPKDLSKLPHYAEMLELIQERHMSVLDAYKLAHFDTSRDAAAQRAAAAARQASKGKTHLQGTDTRGTGGVTVPEDIAANYRLMNPGMTDAQIAADYAKRIRKGR